MGRIVAKFGWQYVFWTMGAIGIVLTPLWFMTVFSPRNHPRITADELRYIEQGGGFVNMDMGSRAGARFNVKWSHVRQLLGSRMLLGVYGGQFFITTLTYFFIQWFPGYLEKRGMSILKVGLIAPLPALCGFIGGILGGRFSDSLLGRGCSLTFSRKAPIVFGMLLSAAMLLLCNEVQAEWMVVAVLCLAFFGKGIGALGWTVVSDTSPKEIMGLSGGLFNMFGNTAAITTAIVIGRLIKNPSGFSQALIFVGANAVAAVFCYVFIVGEIKRLELRHTPSPQSPQPALRHAPGPQT
jgi:ACS family glucarate transporter-like MFS transporter